MASTHLLAELLRLKNENEALKKEKQKPPEYTEYNNIDCTENESKRLPSFQMGFKKVNVLIPKFDPDDENKQCTSEWIENIEKLQIIYNWNDSIVLLYASMQLEGAARFWYQTRQQDIKVWSDFKRELTTAFPPKDAYSTLLEIMTRTRKKNESIEYYFYHIVSLAKRVNLPETSTMKYIISGLGDPNLVAVLLVSNAKTLDDLLKQIRKYEEMATLERYRLTLSENFEKDCSEQENNDNEKKKFFEQRKTKKQQQRSHPYKDNSNKETSPKHDKPNKKPCICFNCNLPGHPARLCKNDFLNRLCYNCRQRGHMAKDCPNDKQKK